MAYAWYFSHRSAKTGGQAGPMADENPQPLIIRKILSSLTELGGLLQSSELVDWLDEIPGTIDITFPAPGHNLTLHDDHLKTLLVDLHFYSSIPPGPVRYYPSGITNAKKLAKIGAKIAGRTLVFGGNDANLPTIFHGDWHEPCQVFVAHRCRQPEYAGRALIAPFASRNGEVYITNHPSQGTDLAKKLDYYNYVQRPYGYHQVDSVVPGIDHCADCAHLSRAFKQYPKLQEKFGKIAKQFHIQLWQPGGHGNYIQRYKSPEEVIKIQSLYTQYYLSECIKEYTPRKVTAERANVFYMANKITALLDIPQTVKTSLIRQLPIFFLFPPQGRFCSKILEWSCRNDYWLVETLRVLLIRLFAINKHAKITPVVVSVPKCYEFIGEDYANHSKFLPEAYNQPVLFGDDLNQYLPKKYELWTPYAMVNINSDHIESRHYYYFEKLPTASSKNIRVVCIVSLPNVLGIFIESYFYSLGFPFILISGHVAQDAPPDIYPTQHLSVSGTSRCIVANRNLVIKEFRGQTD